MANIFANVGAGGGVQTVGGSGSEYKSLKILREGKGTYNVSWSKLSVVPSVIVGAQSAKDDPRAGSYGYLTKDSMYVYTKTQGGDLIDSDFSFVMHF